MRLMMFETRPVPHLGMVEGDSVRDITAAGGPATLLAAIEGGAAALTQIMSVATKAPRIALGDARPALPIASPGKIVCVGLNYLEHAKEGGHAPPSYPSFFLRVPSSLLAAGRPVVRPACSEQLDYEAELTVVIGKRGRHIREEDALDHVFGYTLFNDASVRDYQRKTSQWTAGKNFDATGPLGPHVVTADELPIGASGLRIQSRLNGRVMQDSNTSDMIFPVARTIAILSEIMTLEPGDLIATGTPSGVAHARKPPAWMKAGDTIEVEVERIGVLSNPIVDER
jgi:2-keto-4-pentenoate hydratase/2-oxohepta-3-ene-1,7-dioic acid hydratase in catechol pathway